MLFAVLSTILSKQTLSTEDLHFFKIRSFILSYHKEGFGHLKMLPLTFLFVARGHEEKRQWDGQDHCPDATKRSHLSRLAIVPCYP